MIRWNMFYAPPPLRVNATLLFWVAGREKDLNFVSAMLKFNMVYGHAIVSTINELDPCHRDIARKKFAAITGNTAR